MRHQKAALSKQREDYMKKAGILKKELETLKDQRNELRGDPKRSPSPDTKRFLKENTKLQVCEHGQFKIPIHYKYIRLFVNLRFLVV